MDAPDYCAVNYAVSEAMRRETPKVECVDKYGDRIERTRLYNYRDLSEDEIVKLTMKNPSLMEYPEIRHVRTKRLVSRLSDIAIPSGKMSENLARNRGEMTSGYLKGGEKKKNTPKVRGLVKKISSSNNDERVQRNKPYDFLKL